MPEISKKLYEALNGQIQKEVASAYLYLSMSSYCETINLKGAASWLRAQWEEELVHALKLVDYINSRGNKVVLKAIEAPQVEFKSLLDVFENVLAHEQKVSEAINQLYGLAVKEGDFAAQAFLQWFVSEQVEEEATAGEVVEMIRLAGDRGSAVLMVDRQLAGRDSSGDGD